MLLLLSESCERLREITSYYLSYETGNLMRWYNYQGEGGHKFDFY